MQSWPRDTARGVVTTTWWPSRWEHGLFAFALTKEWARMMDVQFQEYAMRVYSLRSAERTAHKRHNNFDVRSSFRGCVGSAS